jgi:hypothetical protein
LKGRKVRKLACPFLIGHGKKRFDQMFGGIARINGAFNGVDQEVHSTHSKFKLWK